MLMAVLVASLVSPGTGHFACAEIISLESIGDTYISSLSADSNFGTATGVKVGTSGGGIRQRGLLTFDVAAAVPAGSLIQSVQLKINVEQAPSDDPVISNFGLFRLLRPWAEMEATWNNRLSNTPWAAPG